FACWDAIFGTLYVPAGREELSYGLYGDEHLRFASVPTLYLRPFASLWRTYGRRLRPSPPQYVPRPPDRSKVNPVVNLQAGETIHGIIRAGSSSSPQRFIGILSVMYLTCASGRASTMGVRMTAGASAFTVMPVSA